MYSVYFNCNVLCPQYFLRYLRCYIAIHLKFNDNKWNSTRASWSTKLLYFLASNKLNNRESLRYHSTGENNSW